MNLFKRSSNEFPAKVQQFIFENSPDAYFVIANGIIVQCNKALEIILDMPWKDILGVEPGKLSPELQADGKRSGEKAVETLNLALKKRHHMRVMACYPVFMGFR